MFVIQNKSSGRFVQRVTNPSIASVNSYRHVDLLDDATLFLSFGQLLEWIEVRYSAPKPGPSNEYRQYLGGFGGVENEWQIVEVNKVERPQHTLGKVIG